MPPSMTVLVNRVVPTLKALGQIDYCESLVYGKRSVTETHNESRNGRRVCQYPETSRQSRLISLRPTLTIPNAIVATTQSISPTSHFFSVSSSIYPFKPLWNGFALTPFVERNSDTASHWVLR